MSYRLAKWIENEFDRNSWFFAEFKGGLQAVCDFIDYVLKDNDNFRLDEEDKIYIDKVRECYDISDKKPKKEKKVTPEKELPTPPADLLYEEPIENTPEQDVTTDSIENKQQEIAPKNETPAVSRATTGGEKYIKDIEIHGNNVVDANIILNSITQKKGDVFNRESVQADLKNIYALGFFSEKMRAIPVNNPDGTITLKIILEENTPVTDFTIEGNTVVSTEEILSYLIDMKGKPQNISKLNEAIAGVQQCYASKGFILARIDSVTDDPDGTINISIREGVINRILIAGNEKTKDFVIERNVLTEPGMVYNENLLKEDIVRLYASQAFKDVTREIEPCEDIPDAYDITINVQEQRTASVSLGGGLDTVTGVFGSVGIADNNFRGMNQRLSLNGLVGSGVILNDASIKRRMNMQIELSFFEPYFLNADTSLMSKIFYRDFGSYQVPVAIERRLGGEVTVAHRMKKNKHLTSTLSLGLENIDVKEGDYLHKRANIGRVGKTGTATGASAVCGNFGRIRRDLCQHQSLLGLPETWSGFV